MGGERVTFAGRVGLVVALAAMAAMLWLAQASSPGAPAQGQGGDVLTIDRARAVLEPSSGERREGEVDLARRWDSEFPGLGGRAVYRVALPPRSGAEPMALLFSRVGNQVHVLVNGSTVRRWGTLGDPAYDAAKNAVMVALPSALLHTDRPNELEVEVTIQPQRLGGLSVLRYGPEAVIQPLFDQYRRWRDLAMLVFAAGLVGMGALTGVLWLRQREPMYGCFSLGAFLGVVRIVDRTSPDLPIPWPWLGIVMVACYGAHMLLMCRFSLLALDIRSRVIVGLLDAGIVLGTLLSALSFALGRPGLMTLAFACLTPGSFASLVAVTRFAWRSGGLRGWVFVGALGLSLGAGVYDLLSVRIAGASGLRVTYLQHAMFSFVLVMGWLIAERYSRTVANFHALNADLSRRVDAREQQLKQAFESLREQQHQQVVANERQRIMREIHDGVGSQLVALLNMVARPGADARALREHVQIALDEMRMAVDSLQPANDDLATVLATLRYRLQPRLEAAGIEVVWDVDEFPELRELSPQVVMHVQRILLEAFTNVLKHAQASRVVVRARLCEARQTVVTLQISDNGIGFGADPARDALPAADRAARRGRGLDNMRSRAEAIGAALRIEPASPAGGACVTLEIRVERGESAFGALSRPGALG
jgi:signal transduction histidine kinase